MPRAQYFLAVVPPPPIFEQALELKKHFQENYQSKASLNSPPHITLHMPFFWRDDREESLVQSLDGLSAKLTPAEVVLSNFDCFSPRVIFIRVMPSRSLSDLQYAVKRFCREELNLLNADYKDLPFHPHLTVAFRDLRKAMFTRAWAEFSTREFEAQFSADKMSLLKHDGSRWNVLKEFRLTGSSANSSKVP